MISLVKGSERGCAMHRIKTMIAVSVATFFMAGVAFAQPMEEGVAYRQKNIKEAIHKKLGLTPEQQQKLEENRKAQEEAMKKLHEGMKQQREKLQEALKNPEATRASVEPIVTEMKSLQAQLIDQRMNGIFTAKSILTPEQFAQFNEMAGKHLAAGKGKMRERSKQRKGTWFRKGDDEDLFDEPPLPPSQEE